MKAEAEAQVFNAFTDAARRLIDEAKIGVNENGWCLQAADPADACLVTLRITKDAFQSYNWKAKDPEVIGVDIRRLHRYLDVYGSTDEVTVKSDGDLFTVTGGNIGYEIRLPDPSSIDSSTQVPDIEPTAEVELQQTELRKVVRAASNVADHIKISAGYRSKEVTVEAASDRDELELELGRQEPFEVDVDEDTEALFSLDYLDDISKALNGADMVKVEVATDKPVTLRGEVVDGVEAEFLLAPRIESGGG